MRKRLRIVPDGDQLHQRAFSGSSPGLPASHGYTEQTLYTAGTAALFIGSLVNQTQLGA